MKLKITKSDKQALLAALAVCGIGILFSILIVLGMDIYRKHTYTSVILPDAYRITDFATELHARYLADNAPEEVLGNLYYSEKDPSYIGRYGDDSLFVE